MAAVEPYIAASRGSGQGIDAAALLIQTVFGWPGIILALVLMGAGLWLRKDMLHLTGALVSTGFCLYLTAANWLIGPAVYACNWASWYYLRKQARLPSAALLAPFTLVVLYFAIAVLSQ